MAAAVAALRKHISRRLQRQHLCIPHARDGVDCASQGELRAPRPRDASEEDAQRRNNKAGDVAKRIPAPHDDHSEQHQGGEVIFMPTNFYMANH